MELVSFGAFDFSASHFYFQQIESGLDEFASELVAVAGTSGYFDPNGWSVPPKRGSTLTARLALVVNDAATVDAELDALKKLLYTGRQWLRVKLDDGATHRRTLAKCINVSAPREVEQPRALVPVVLTFQLSEPYWYADGQTTNTVSVNTTPTACDINNVGTAPLVKAVLQFVGTCNRPKFVNNTNGYSIEVNQNFGVSKTLEINLAAQTVTVDGSDAFASVVLPATQIGLFKFDVGANDVDFVAAGGGVPNGIVTLIYRWMYH